MTEAIAVVEAKPIKVERGQREPMAVEVSAEWVVKTKADMSVSKRSRIKTGPLTRTPHRL